MTPGSFLTEIAHPNMVATFDRADDMRAIVNVVLALLEICREVVAEDRPS